MKVTKNKLNVVALRPKYRSVRKMLTAKNINNFAVSIYQRKYRAGTINEIYKQLLNADPRFKV